MKMMTTLLLTILAFPTFAISVKLTDVQCDHLDHIIKTASEYNFDSDRDYHAFNSKECVYDNSAFTEAAGPMSLKNEIAKLKRFSVKKGKRLLQDALKRQSFNQSNRLESVYHALQNFLRNPRNNVTSLGSITLEYASFRGGSSQSGRSSRQRPETLDVTKYGDIYCFHSRGPSYKIGTFCQF